MFNKRHYEAIAKVKLFTCSESIYGMDATETSTLEEIQKINVDATCGSEFASNEHIANGECEECEWVDYFIMDLDAIVPNGSMSFVESGVVFTRIK